MDDALGVLELIFFAGAFIFDEEGEAFGEVGEFAAAGKESGTFE